MKPWRGPLLGKSKELERGGYTYPISTDQYASYFSFNNNLYPFGINQSLSGEKEEPISSDFAGLVSGAYKSNGVIYACMTARALLFSEARFQFRQWSNGQPGPLFGTPELAVLETPSPGHTTRDLLARAIQDVDLAGNWFGWRDGNNIRRLRPDWVSIVLGSNIDDGEASVMPDAEVIGYVYHPGGYSSSYDPVIFTVEQVAHFAPQTDPTANFRGMSWLTPVIREIMSDSAATAHKLKFFESGATSNMIIKVPEGVRKDAFEQLVEQFKNKHEGLANAYKTIVLSGGADATVVGANFQQMDFKVTQGAGETRIAAAARMHPVVVGLSEGLQGASLNAGNFNSARRLVADGTMRPLWGAMAGALGRIITTPGGAELWYADKHISFLQEDEKDAAEIRQADATTMRTLADGGWTRDSIVAAMNSGGDWTLLKDTGIPTVQVQQISPSQTTASNGSGKLPAVQLP